MINLDGGVLAQLGDEAFRSMRSQSFFAVPSASQSLRHQWNHCTKIRMDDRRTSIW